MKISSLVCLTASAVLAAGAQVSGIFKSIDSINYVAGSSGYPYTNGPNLPSWINTLSWGIDGSKVTAGDTFTLTLPCTFKFTSTSSTVDLKVGSNVYATCTFNSGYTIVAYSSMQCTASNLINPLTRATGSVNFPVAYNVGGSAAATDLEDSTCFTTGSNTVSYMDGPNTISLAVNFVGGIISQGTVDPSILAYNVRVIPDLNKNQVYVLAANCPGGYSSGVLGIQLTNALMDCDSVHALISNSLNSWYFPKSTSTNFQVTTTCTPAGGLKMTYLNVPAGFRPFIDGLVSMTGGQFSTSYTNQYTCKNQQYKDNSRLVNWGNYDNSGSGSNGNDIIVTTKTWTGSTTKITTLPFNTAPGNTKTIEVDVPVPTITTTTTW